MAEKKLSTHLGARRSGFFRRPTVKRVRQAWFRGQSWGAQDRSEIQSDQKDQEHQLKEHRVHRRPEALASILEDPRCQAHTRHALELVRERSEDLLPRVVAALA